MRHRFLLLAAVVLSGCVSVDYVGKSFTPTANVDVYMSDADVRRPYEVMGQVRAEVPSLPFQNSAQQLQDRLVAEARSKGADGIILGGLDRRIVGETTHTTGQGTKTKKGKKVQYQETTTSDPDEVTELRGQLIKYRNE